MNEDNVKETVTEEVKEAAEILDNSSQKRKLEYIGMWSQKILWKSFSSVLSLYK